MKILTSAAVTLMFALMSFGTISLAHAEDGVVKQDNQEVHQENKDVRADKKKLAEDRKTFGKGSDQVKADKVQLKKDRKARRELRAKRHQDKQSS